MAVRRWAVRPDPDVGYVTREQMRDAFLDAEAVQATCGGIITIMGQRAHTDVPGEMVTTFLLVEWKDRTDAKVQPEPTVLSAPAPAPAPAEPEAVEQPAEPGGDPEAELYIEEDGLDRRTLLDEDVSEIPAALR